MPISPLLLPLSLRLPLSLLLLPLIFRLLLLLLLLLHPHVFKPISCPHLFVNLISSPAPTLLPCHPHPLPFIPYHLTPQFAPSPPLPLNLTLTSPSPPLPHPLSPSPPFRFPNPLSFLGHVNVSSPRPPPLLTPSCFFRNNTVYHSRGNTPSIHETFIYLITFLS